MPKKHQPRKGKPVPKRVGKKAIEEKRYGGKTEKEWKEWSEEFGKAMEKVGKGFGEKKRISWWPATFGSLGPLVGAVVGTICLAIGIIVLNWINSFANSPVISGISNFLWPNIPWFFLIYLFLGYSRHLLLYWPKAYWLSPLITAVKIAVALWIIFGILSGIALAVSNTQVASAAAAISANLPGILVALAIIGYIVLFLLHSVRVASKS